jgi:hypothetical protein
MKSPLFSERFQGDNWTLLYFNTFIEAFTKAKSRTNLEPLLGQPKSAAYPRTKDESSDQQRLMEFGGSDAPTEATPMRESMVADE